MITKIESPITLKKGKTKIILSLGVGSYNPDESKDKKLFELKNRKFEPWLQYEGTWYFITVGSKYNSISDIAAQMKRDCYTEEMFLEKIYELIEK